MYYDAQADRFWDDGDWIDWEEFDPDIGLPTHDSHLAKLEHEAELRLRYPKADITLVPYFKALVGMSADYHADTGRHLHSYGDIGELFGAIVYGIDLHRNFATGSDGRLGDDFVEIKTIAPFSTKDRVRLRLDRHFSQLLLVKINKDFQISGRMIPRRSLPPGSGKYMTIRWEDVAGPDRPTDTC